MHIEKFTVGPFQQNTYVLWKQEKAILIDPGFHSEFEYSPVKELLSTLGLNSIYLTHAHIDHVLGLQRVLNDFDVPVFLHNKDLFLWQNFGNQSRMYGLSGVDFGFTPNNITVDEEIEVEGLHFQSLYTPGHSPDHMSFYFKNEGVLVAGDALFRESIGRTDLYKGDFDLLSSSIKSKLYSLPESTTVYSGHGIETTIAHEKKYNPFVRS